MNIDIHSKYYIRKASGGYNPCIAGNAKYGLRPFAGSVLPNCTSFACGRFNERLKLKKCKYLGNYKYIEDIISTSKKKGLKTGSDPVEGAVICWGKGSKYHMGIVEKVINKDKITYSESGWNYKKEPIVRQLTKSRGKAGNWGNSKKFNCFIYPPENIGG